MHVPIRTCVACRRSAGKRELTRLAVAQGAVQVDPTGSHPGRGAYLCALAECVNVAMRRDGAAIRRALRLSRHILQPDQGRVTLDVDALRARLGEVGTPNRSAVTRAAGKRGQRPGRLGDSPSPKAREGVSA